MTKNRISHVFLETGSSIPACHFEEKLFATILSYPNSLLMLVETSKNFHII